MFQKVQRSFINAPPLAIKLMHPLMYMMKLLQLIIRKKQVKYRKKHHMKMIRLTILKIFVSVRLWP